MSDDATPVPNKKKHTVIVQIVTAAISAFTAVSIAKLHENTEIQKAKLGYEELAKHVNEIQDLSAKHSDALAKISGTVETMNGILQSVFMSQSGLKTRTYLPPDIPTYTEHLGPGRPPARTIVARNEDVPPPRKAAGAAVQQLQKLAKKAKAETPIIKPVPVEPVPVKLEEVKEKK